MANIFDERLRTSKKDLENELRFPEPQPEEPMEDYIDRLREVFNQLLSCLMVEKKEEAVKTGPRLQIDRYYRIVPEKLTEVMHKIEKWLTDLRIWQTNISLIDEQIKGYRWESAKLKNLFKENFFLKKIKALNEDWADQHDRWLMEITELEEYCQEKWIELKRQQDMLLGDLVPHTRDSLTWVEDVATKELVFTLHREVKTGELPGYRISLVRRAPEVPFSDELQNSIDNFQGAIDYVNSLEKEFRRLEGDVVDLRRQDEDKTKARANRKKTPFS